MKIYDAKLIVPGIILFLAAATSPLWYNTVKGATAEGPNVNVNSNAKSCIEPTQWMIDHHPELLDSWRDNVVRKNLQTYTASDGKQYQESLATCFSCHKDASQFCNSCHDYIGNSLNCWSCHSQSEGQTSATK